MDEDELTAAMDTENQGAARGRAAGAPAGWPARSPTEWRTRSRWLVHLGLLACAAAALGTLQLLHIRNAIHADVGLAFAGLVIVHLAQRRHRIAGMFARLWGFRRWVMRKLRLLASDAILAFVTVNVVVSGILDWNREPHCSCPASHDLSTGGTCSPLPCSSCTWSSTSRAGGDAFGDPRSDSPAEQWCTKRSALLRPSR